MHDDEDMDFAAIMAEPPGGDNGGRARWQGGQIDAGYDAMEFGASSSERPAAEEHPRELSVAGMQRASFLTGEDGNEWTLGSTARATGAGDSLGYRDLGMTTHRGAVHPDEYLHDDVLIDAAAEMLGTTPDDIRAVYHRNGGPLPANLRDKRAAIDAAVLEAAQNGGNITLLARALGISERSMDNIVARARVSA